MPNVTLRMDEELLERGRKYADRNGTTLTALIRDYVDRATAENGNVIDGWRNRAQVAQGNSQGRTWTREDLQRDVRG
ncbi:MAG: DUF6364 family protein [Coriobacteriia bacterium]|nr:DUF6364 family protein [Coriobacteriia bacterium]